MERREPAGTLISRVLILIGAYWLLFQQDSHFGMLNRRFEHRHTGFFLPRVSSARNPRRLRLPFPIGFAGETGLMASKHRSLFVPLWGQEHHQRMSSRAFEGGRQWESSKGS
jgi:hypothetical protein